MSMRELVDAHGVRGFDVLCITDHVVRSDDPWEHTWGGESRAVPPERFDTYVAEIAREAERARERFGMLVVPGAELTYNDLDPARAAHAVAVGLRSFVTVDAGIDSAIETASSAGAAVIAAHPFPVQPGVGSRLTQRFARDESLRALVHRFELFNRSTLFSWVAEAGLPVVACGDVHEPAHLEGWKTLLPCEPGEEALVSYLRSPRPTYLTRLDEVPALAA